MHTISTKLDQSEHFAAVEKGLQWCFKLKQFAKERIRERQRAKSK